MWRINLIIIFLAANLLKVEVKLVRRSAPPLSDAFSDFLDFSLNQSALGTN